MKARHEANSWPFPYLRDESQKSPSAYGAKTTPDIFVFNADNKLVYRGAPDATTRTTSQNASLDARRASTPCSRATTPATAETEPVGCSVKWKA